MSFSSTRSDVLRCSVTNGSPRSLDDDTKWLLADNSLWCSRIVPFDVGQFDDQRCSEIGVELRPLHKTREIVRIVIIVQPLQEDLEFLAEIDEDSAIQQSQDLQVHEQSCVEFFFRVLSTYSSEPWYQPNFQITNWVYLYLFDLRCQPFFEE